MPKITGGSHTPHPSSSIDAHDAKNANNKVKENNAKAPLLLAKKNIDENIHSKRRRQVQKYVKKGHLPKDFTPPSLIKEVDKIGEGGFADVMKGISDSNETVAIKKQSDRAFGAGAEYEKNIISQLDHPYIIKMHDRDSISYTEENLQRASTAPKAKTTTGDWVVVSNDILTLEMASSDLLDMVENTTLTEQQKVTLACDICSGTAYMAEKGICHQDLKPQNILIVDGKAKISDFGEAVKFTDENGDVIPSKANFCRTGTPNFQPYESLTNRLKLHAGETRKKLVPNITDPTKVDSWGCGIVLGYLLSSGDVMALPDDALATLKPLYDDFDFEREDERGRAFRNDMHETLSKTKHAYQEMLDSYFEKIDHKIPTGTMPILKSLLAIEPENRLTASEAFERLKKLEVTLDSQS